MGTSKNSRVQIRQADRAIAELGVKRVDLLKIDVEGYEKEVLAGLAGTLRRDRPIFLIELVGADMKGGFRSEAELRAGLYNDHWRALQLRMRGNGVQCRANSLTISNR